MDLNINQAYSMIRRKMKNIKTNSKYLKKHDLFLPTSKGN